MSANETKNADPSTTNKAEKQPKQDSQASEDKEGQRTSRKTGQSQVSKANEETLFATKKAHPKTQALVSIVRKSSIH